MEYGKTNILNKVFTKNTLNKWISLEKSDIYAITIKRFVKDAEGKTNKELISDIYTKMKTDYRNEYYYKNTLLNKLLIGKHSVNTTSALTEVNINKSKADFVLINGKAVVYEIKTELDNLERLSSQIDDYYKAFDHVAVVTYEKNLQQLQRVLDGIDKPVGIYVLRKNGKLGTVRKPQRHISDLDKDIIFKLLRKSEYEDIIAQWYGYLPEVTQFKYYAACKKMFLELDTNILYQEFVQQIKKRNLKQPNYIDYHVIPSELRLLVYLSNLKKSEYESLCRFLTI